MRNIKYVMIGIALLSSGALSAATITWDASPASVSVNDIFTIDIVGSGFTSSVDGGGVGFSYDSSVLNVMSITIDQTVWDFGAGIQTGLIDNITGTVDGISVNAWSDVSGNFSVASVTFQAIGNGPSALALNGWNFNPWASGGSILSPDYVDSSVLVSAVPVPAAVWLFGSGLIGLAGLAKRKAS